MQQTDSPLPQEGQAGVDMPVMSGQEYEIATGEPLAQTLDLNTWHPGADLAEMYERLRQEVADAVKQETIIQEQIRDKIFPMLKTMSGAPPCAGVYQATEDQLKNVHNKLLFNGGIEACDVS